MENSHQRFLLCESLQSAGSEHRLGFYHDAIATDRDYEKIRIQADNNLSEAVGKALEKSPYYLLNKTDTMKQTTNDNRRPKDPRRFEEIVRGRRLKLNELIRDNLCAKLNQQAAIDKTT